METSSDSVAQLDESKLSRLRCHRRSVARPRAHTQTRAFSSFHHRTRYVVIALFSFFRPARAAFYQRARARGPVAREHAIAHESVKA